MDAEELKKLRAALDARFARKARTKVRIVFSVYDGTCYKALPQTQRLSVTSIPELGRLVDVVRESLVDWDAERRAQVAERKQ